MCLEKARKLDKPKWMVCYKAFSRPADHLIPNEVWVYPWPKGQRGRFNRGLVAISGRPGFHAFVYRDDAFDFKPYDTIRKVKILVTHRGRQGGRMAVRGLKMKKLKGRP